MSLLEFHSICFIILTKELHNRTIKPDITSANSASESSLLSKPDSILWPDMDSAEAERPSEVLWTQEARLNRQEEFQTTMAANMGQIFFADTGATGLTLPNQPRTPDSTLSSLPGNANPLRRSLMQAGAANSVYRRTWTLLNLYD